MQQTTQLFEQIKLLFSSKDSQKLASLFGEIFLQLTKLPLTTDKELLIHRETLELACLFAIRTADIPAFERYYQQLKPYYFTNKVCLPKSQRQHTLVGLNLLCLLAQNRISDFHQELECLEFGDLDNIYIKHPIKIEQCLMEGSYSKVWNSRVNVPAEEYVFFIDILMATIRNEIASCSEKAYKSLPLQDAATLLYFKTVEEVYAFGKERNWNISASEKKVHFGSGLDVNGNEIPTEKMIKLALEYAHELEKIV